MSGNIKNISLGLKENWKQFTLLVIINGFVGGMVGLERTLLPDIAEADYQIAANTAILSFIIVFGITKAIANYYAGSLANKVGRKNLLIIGWLFGLPVPILLIYAPDWNWIVFANILLGINQGLAWSSTVVMKIDLVGEKHRGFAMGLNESAGYIAVGVVAFLTGLIATQYGLRPYPFYMGIGFAIIGLLASIFLVKDTQHHVNLETKTSTIPRLKNIFIDTSWRNNNLGSITQAGLVNNLNDGAIWGIFPIFLALKGFNLIEIARIVAIYPIVWGLGQLITGKLADHLNKRNMLFFGMFLQGIALIAFIIAQSFNAFLVLSMILGLGTAIVYPTFLASIAYYTHPEQRAKSIGVFRFWRDLGYAIGALFTGIIADVINVEWSIVIVGIVTIISSVIIRFRMD